MKKFIFGLIVGLIIGFLGVLAWTQAFAVGPRRTTEQARDAANPERRKRPAGDRGPTEEVGLEVARVKLRTRLDGKPEDQQPLIVLDALDAAIFDRSWVDVRVATEKLRELRRAERLPVGSGSGESSGTTAVEVADPETPSASSPIVVAHELAAKRFWSGITEARNAATEAAARRDESARLAGLQKLVATPAAIPDERRAREDAILLIGYRCGTKGLLVLAGLMRDPVEDGDQERVVTAISRSGSERAGEMLARLVSEPRDAELRDKALAAMANSADVVRGASPGLSTIAGLLDPGRPLDLKLGIAELARHVDLKAPAGAGGQALVVALGDALTNPAEPMALRIRIAEVLAANAKENLGLAESLIRSAERALRSDRSPKLRRALINGFTTYGDADSLEALQDVTPTLDAPGLREAATRALRDLRAKFGE